MSPTYRHLIESIQSSALLLLDSYGNVVTGSAKAADFFGLDSTRIHNVDNSVDYNPSPFNALALRSSNELLNQLQTSVERGSDQRQVKIRKADGTELTISVITVPIIGEANELIGFTQELEPFQQNLASTAPNQNLHASEVQSVARLGSWEWDILHDHITWSPELFEIFDLDPREFNPSFEAYLEHVYIDDQDYTSSVISEALVGGADFSFEHRIVKRDGSIRIILSRGRVIKSVCGDSIRMIGTAMDITEQKTITPAQSLPAQPQILEPEPVKETEPIQSTDLATSAVVENGLAGMKVLLADDSHDNLTLMRLLLEKVGVSVETAVNGIEAVDRVLAEEFDAVLMDSEMPLMNGLEATKRLRAMGLSLPIISLIDGSHIDGSQSENLEASREAGSSASLLRPIRRNALYETLGSMHSTEL